MYASMQVVDKNASVFSLDRKITPEQTEEVIYQSIEKLMETDNPALEMSDRCLCMHALVSHLMIRPMFHSSCCCCCC